MSSRRYALRDDQWDRIKDFLPGRQGSVGRTAKNNRLFVEAILYRYRAGYLGGIYLRDSVISEWCTLDLPVGTIEVSGSKYSQS